MRKPFLISVCVLVAAVLMDGRSRPSAAGPDSGKLVISSIDIIPPSGADCTYRWRITIDNTGSEDVNDPILTVNAYQGRDSGSWQPAGGRVLGPLAAGAKKELELTFRRLAGKTHFKATLYRSSMLLSESVIPLPAESSPSIIIEDCTLTDTGYRATIRNAAATGISDLGIQGHAAAALPAPSWTAAGGMRVACLEGGRTYSHSGPRASGSKVIRIQVSLGSLLAERIFDLR